MPTGTSAHGAFCLFGLLSPHTRGGPRNAENTKHLGLPNKASVHDSFFVFGLLQFHPRGGTRNAEVAKHLDRLPSSQTYKE